MYNDAPILCPPSWLHDYYSSEFQHRIKVVVGPAQWGTCIRTLVHVADTFALACWNNNIATASPGENDIRILDALAGSQTAVLSGHTDWITSLTYSLDGTFLVSGSSDKTIKLWDVQTGGVVKTLCGHTDQVHSVSISADDTMIVSTSQDRTVCLWNIKIGSYCIIERYEDFYNTVTFSPKNSQLLSSSGDGTVQQWDVNGHKIGSPVSGDRVVFSPDGTQFISWKGETAIIRNTDSKMTVVEFDLDSRADCCCFSPDGRLLAVAALHVIYLWDITSPNPCLIQTLVGHSDSITSLVFSSTYSLVSASNDLSIKFWHTGTSLAGPGTPSTESTSLALTPISSVSLQAKDSLAFSIDLEGVVKTWDILTGSCKGSYKTQIKRIEHADIQLISGRLIIVWKEADEWEINVWDAEKGKLQTIGMPDGYPQGLRIIGDGSRVLQLHQSFIQAWDIWTGENLCEERVGRDDGSFNIFQRVDFDTLRMDGSRILVRFGESLVQGWDFGAPGSTPIQFSKTSSDRPHLNFIDIRKWSRNSPVRIEDSITGKEVFQLRGRYAKPSATQWDGQHLIIGYDSGEVLILDFKDALSQ